ncbi:glycoside hydrolase family 97 protein [Streptomyces avicenniae]|uniref:glycoside hydrolase family 97 protein n=1 Tax=Streptomyces avicenniae TaxID=500153 RepID=UPI00069BAEE1|nr:glycoside hydrolase family 97 protein [Streptomyces avicenniae]
MSDPLRPPHAVRPVTALTAVLAMLLLTLSAVPSSAAPRPAADPAAQAALLTEGPAVTSPDGTLTLAVSVLDGRLTYGVSRAGAVLVAPSGLGLRLTDGTLLGGDVRITGHRTRSHDSTWRPVWGADAEVRDRHEELTVELRQRDGRTFRLVARAYDDGVAFRYEVPRQRGLRSLEIIDEATEFALTGDPTAWWTPRDDNSDENAWRSTPVSAMGASNAPVTFRYADGTHLSVHEADLTDYAAMTVVPRDGRLHAELVPTPGREAAVVTGTGRALPWRVLTVTQDAAGLVASHLLENLNPPCRICDTDTSWIEPVKYVGIWWVMQQDQATWETGPRHGATTERAKRYIDFAAANGIEGLLAEGWNEGWGGDWGDQSFTRSTADFDLEAVVAYADAKGVEFIMHNETGANVENYEAQLDEAFALYERLGVNYVKTGYVGDIPGHNHYDQYMVNHYRRVLEAAAEHRINVNCHECVHASGEMRTYPNALSREAVRGQEWDAFSEGNSPEHTLILPFTRGLSGPMDYTPGIMDILWDPQRLGRRVHTTVGKQLAYYVTYFSGLQMAADLPEHYRGAPGLQFIRDVPARWDRTEVLAAEVGDHLVTARRSGDEWFTGAMTGEHARTLRYPLSFLGAGDWVAEAYTDAPDADYETNPTALAVTRTLVTAADTFTAELVRSGGQAVRFRPATRDDLATLPRLGAATANP